jgi:hypothetical protein
MDKLKLSNPALFLVYSLALCIVSSIGGCTLSSSEHTQNVTVSFEQPDRLRFSGKGSSAGIMMSSLGTMGVAIGIAIDEGIGKEIAHTAKQAPLDLNRTLSNGILQQFSIQQFTYPVKVHIERYGFKSVPGEGDSVMAELIVSYQLKDTIPVKVSFPSDISPQVKETLLHAQLSEIKVSPETIALLLQKAIPVPSPQRTSAVSHQDINNMNTVKCINLINDY